MKKTNGIQTRLGRHHSPQWWRTGFRVLFLVFCGLASIWVFLQVVALLNPDGGAHEDINFVVKQGSESATTALRNHAISGQPIPVRKCSSEENIFQATYKAAAKVRGCPPADDIWMRIVQMLMPHAKVFMDIGSNKGYSAARFFALWSPELGFDSKKLYKSIKKVTSNKQATECGACGDCQEDTGALTSISERLCSAESRHSSNPNYRRPLEKAVDYACTNRDRTVKPIQVFSFDGNKVLIKAVSDAVKDFDSSSNQRAEKQIGSNWFLELAAFSDQYTPNTFLEFALNGELGHIVSDSGRGNDAATETIKVPVLTIDQFMLRQQLLHIDFLKIDTEGHDLTVLQGASKSLGAGKVTLLMFEYNEFWPSDFKGSNDPLGVVVDDLSKMNYICYMEGKNLLLRLSFCWNDELRKRQWSNVWCAYSRSSTGLAIISVFDSYSLAFN